MFQFWRRWDAWKPRRQPLPAIIVAWKLWLALRGCETSELYTFSAVHASGIREALLKLRGNFKRRAGNWNGGNSKSNDPGPSVEGHLMLRRFPCHPHNKLPWSATSPLRFFREVKRESAAVVIPG